MTSETKGLSPPSKKRKREEGDAAADEQRQFVLIACSCHDDDLSVPDVLACGIDRKALVQRMCELACQSVNATIEEHEAEDEAEISADTGRSLLLTVADLIAADHKIVYGCEKARNTMSIDDKSVALRASSRDAIVPYESIDVCIGGHKAGDDDAAATVLVQTEDSDACKMASSWSVIRLPVAVCM